MKEVRLLSTSGILGYGFPEESLRAGLARNPDMIGVDGGSVDPGPHYLGSGTPFCSPRAIRRDLRLMLNAAVERGIPMVIGTCGGAGGEPHLEMIAQMAREIAAEDGLTFKMAVIHAEQPRDYLHEKLGEGRIRPLGRTPDLDPATIDRAARVVGMMGPEPFMKALDEGAQIVLAGRSSDPAPWAATIMRSQIPPAPAWFAGKMLECGATPAVPKGHDVILVTAREDHIEIEPMNQARVCTPLSIANHSLHENASPIHHVEPGGMLDTSECRFEAVSDRAVRVSGMRWTPAETYTVKLEAAELVGYRALAICGTRDPLLISQLDDFLGRVREGTESKSSDIGFPPDSYRLIIRTYGVNGVMAGREPRVGEPSHEIGFVVEVVADTQEAANAVVGVARAQMLHTDFPGRLCREGNMAFPFSPSDIPVGPVYRFSMHHTVAPEDPCEMFPIDHETV